MAVAWRCASFGKAVERKRGGDNRVTCEYIDDMAGSWLLPRSSEARWQALSLHSVADGMFECSDGRTV